MKESIILKISRPFISYDNNVEELLKIWFKKIVQ